MISASSRIPDLAAPPSPFATLVEVLRGWTADDPRPLAYRFLVDGEQDEQTLTRGELDRRVRCIAAHLQALGAEGKRAVLLYAPGLDYVAGFFACLYAGVIAVPAYPPDPSRLNRTLPRLQAIVADSQAEIVLTTSMIAGMAQFLFAQAPDLQDKRWIATDALPEGGEDGYRDPGVTADTIAFLQYTSGSTGTPKGVILTHRNLIHNLGIISRSMRFSRETVMVSWLPPYHDMGLIGGILAPIFNGGSATLMAPVAFLQRPYRWMQAISRHRATISGGPNFAFDLCTAKISPAELAALDLSAWTVAFSGAEAVRAGTLHRFQETFGPVGLRPEAIFPCYGLAEGTLIVSGGEVERRPEVQCVDPIALDLGRVERVKSGGREIVGCGHNLGDQEIALVDPVTLFRVPSGEIGEIWVRGGSVAQGYWQRPEDTARTFHATLGDRPGVHFLRTGDLGFFIDDELFIASRLKDLIILRGRNHYPQDIERTAEESHPALRRGCSAAFPMEEGGEERLGFAIEVERGLSPDAATFEAIYTAIRNTVAEAHDIRPHTIVLLKAGSIPKTSSGKIQRSECRSGTGNHTLTEVGRSELAEQAGRSGVYVAPRTAMEEKVAAIWAEVFGLPRIGIHDRFFDLGGHSLMATLVVSRIRDELKVDLGLRSLFDAPTVAQLAEQVESTRQGFGVTYEQRIPRIPRAATMPASFAQERMWFLDALEGENPAYHIPVAIGLDGRLDVGALESALQAIVTRHEALRTTFASRSDASVQIIHPTSALVLTVIDLGALPEGEQAHAAAAEARAEARRPFDLGRGPLVRARLLRLGESTNTLLLTLHHIIGDGWSMSVLLRELGVLYRAALAGEESEEGEAASLPALPIQYADYAVWQRGLLSGALLERQLAHWTRALEGAPEVLDLPTDRPRPPILRHRGARHEFPVSASLHQAIKALCQRDDVTPYMVLLAAFATLLHRITGQEDLVIGSPIAGRARPETEGLIGLFVNTLALRARLGGDSTFREVLLRLKETSLAAYAHQDLPFERLVEALRPRRDRSRTPLFQVMFILQNSPLPPLSLPGLRLRPSLLDAGASKFDLTLELTESEGALDGALTFNADLFDEPTIQRFAEHYLTLLAAAVADPKSRVGDLPLLSPAEQTTLLGAWNETSAALPTDTTIAHLFEAQVDRTPDALALVAGGERLSYRALDERANRLAHHLRERGVGPDRPVGLCLDRHAGLIVGMLGILKAGGAYLPLDPTHPPARLRQLLGDAGAAAVVTEHALLEGLAEAPRVLLDDPAVAALPATRLALSAGPEHLCYVLTTSGSTGTPKGVAVEHRQVLNYLFGLAPRLALQPGSSYAHISTFVADLGNTVLFPPLCLGGTLHLVPADAVADPEAVSAYFHAEGIDCLKIVPSHLAALLGARHPARVLPRTLLVLGGEVASWELCAQIEQLAPELRIMNHYGPTETTVGVLTFPVEHGLRKEGAPIVPLGRPLPNTRVYLLDGRRTPVPIGVPGEVYLGGAGVARGYLHRPELTAERFLADPFVGGEARMYRTGDRARYLPDGTLVFLGRVDFQVKIRGFRIELGEIDAVLAQHPAVAEVVTVAREDSPGEKRLVAYVVTAQEPGPTAADLKTFLDERLPAHMVPAAIVLLARLPLTANGKIDRAALPAPEVRAAVGRAELRGPVEEALAAIFAEVLKATAIGAEDDFFDRGGHSLLATQVISRIRTVFGVELPLRTVFDAPTVAALSERVEMALRSGLGLIAPPLAKAPRASGIELSFAQERLWFLSQLEPDSASYVVPGAVRLEGHLDPAALERALREIIRRHEVLRTTFTTDDGRPVAVIHPEVDCTVPLTRWTSVPIDERDQAIRELCAAEARRPFDLASGPMLRARLIQLDETTHVLLLMMHHIVSDGWTRGVLNHELALLYRAFCESRPSPLPELTVQYTDYAAWQRRWLMGDVLDRQLAYWKKALDGAPRVLDLPADRPRAAVATHRGTRRFFALPLDLLHALRELSRREGVTLFMTLLAAFDVLLHRYAGQNDIVVGSPIAGRTHAETEGLIGFFVNTLVLRAQVAPALPFRDLLRQLKDTCIEAYAHQDMPFERLVQEIAPERDLGRAPLFQVLFTLQNAPREAMTLPGLTLRPIMAESGAAKFDLSLGLAEGPEGLQGSIEYASDLFDAATITRMIGHLEILLRGIAADPGTQISALPLLDEAERQTLLGTFNPPIAPPPAEARIHALFEAQARRTPDALALVAPDGALKFRELDARSTQLAHRLRALGVGPDQPVGILLDRSVGLIVAMLGILKAGGAYVPLDPSHPRGRIAQILDEAGARVAITTSALEGALPEQGICRVTLDGDADSLAAESVAPLDGGAGPEHLCYVLFTSGSTGKPKGVAIEHRQVASYLHAVTARMHLPAGASYAHVSTFSADLGNTVLFPPLCQGGTLHLIAQDRSSDPDALAAYFHEHRIDCVKIVPSHLTALLSAARPERVLPRRLLVLGGEASSWELIERLHALSPATRVLNHYGPTETTVGVLTYEVDPGERELGAPIVPLGRPLANARVYVLDDAQNPSPIGVPGELYLGGAGVARGYHGRPDLTAERFLPDPFVGGDARVYRTGDRARVLPSGAIVFLGRIDHQIKLRGYRIELGEIESALTEHPSLRGAVVLCREDRPGEKRLVAYVTGDDPGAIAPADLKTSLAGRLPEYMVPSVFVVLPRLPLNANGKIDRAALPAPDTGESEREAAYVAPSTPAEVALAAIWAGLLRLEKVGLHDNFFEVGGDSILSIQIVSRAHRAGFVLTPRQIFQHQTIAALAAVAKTVESTVVLDEGPVIGPVPLTPIQRRFLDYQMADAHHWNQSLFLSVREALDPALLREVLAALLLRHDTLRLRLHPGDSGAEQVFTAPSADVDALLWTVDLRDRDEAAQRAALEEKCAEAQASLDLAAGPILRVVLFDLGADRPNRLLLVIHHLAVDGVSWRIFLGDLWAAYEARRRGEGIRLPPRKTSFKRWSEALARHARSAAALAEEPSWLSPARTKVRPIPVDFRKGDDTEATSRSVTVALPADETTTLLRDVPRAYRTQISDVLLTALAQTIAPWARSGVTLIDLEGHGREEIFPDLDVSHTMGWFTVVYPMALELGSGMGPGEALKSIKEQLRAVPGRGLGYGLLCYLRDGEPVAGRLKSLPRAEIGFNYLGQLDQGLPEASPFRFAQEPSGPDHSPRARRRYLLELNASIVEGQLVLKWTYGEGRYRRSTVEQLRDRYLAALRALIAHCISPGAGGYTPSDFKKADLSQDVIDMLAALDAGAES